MAIGTAHPPPWCSKILSMRAARLCACLQPVRLRKSCFSNWSEIAPETQRPCPADRSSSQAGGREVGKKEGVHNVHTLGFGSGRTGAGLGRIEEVFGGVAEIQGLEPGSSPTSGTCFPCSGACGPLSASGFLTNGPLRGPFLLVGRCCGRAAPSRGFGQRKRAAVRAVTDPSGEVP